MEHRIHARLANRVEMHHVAMIGQQIVIGARPEGVLASVSWRPILRSRVLPESVGLRLSGW